MGSAAGGDGVTPVPRGLEVAGSEIGSPPPAAAASVSVEVTDAQGVVRTIPVLDRLFVGRTCQGIDEGHRVLLDGPNISRDHCQFRLDADRLCAVLVDTSTNGTRVNGVLVERSVPVTLSDGDVVAIGTCTLVLRSGSRGSQAFDPHLTIREIDEGRACVVCGDLVDYTTLTEIHGGQVVFPAMHVLFDRLRVLLRDHRGTLYDYVGDAFLAIWEERAMSDAARRGVEFAVAASAEIAAVAPTLQLRGIDGGPLRMGWAVTYGSVAMSAYAGSLAGLLGDAVNTGFRLASTAGRQGRAPVLVTEEAVQAGATLAGMGGPEAVTVKGKQAPVVVRQVHLGAGPG